MTSDPCAVPLRGNPIGFNGSEGSQNPLSGRVIGASTISTERGVLGETGEAVESQKTEKSDCLFLNGEEEPKCPSAETSRTQ